MILAAHATCGLQGVDRDDGLITYGELAVLMGRSRLAGRSLGDPLGAVGFYCLQNDLPALNSIVVNAKTGQPGDAVVCRAGRSVEKEQKAVLNKKKGWMVFRPPSPRQLKLAFK